MFETLKRLYNLGKLNDSSLLKAVKKGWISKKQLSKINSKL